MKIVSWLLVVVPAVYFLALATMLIHHFVVMGGVQSGFWVFGASGFSIITALCACSLIVGVLMIRNR